MKQVRHSVFETNSSSTHSIAIPRDGGTPTYISFNIGEFGWAFEEVDAADYFYTAIFATSDTLEEAEEKISRLKDILYDYDIEYDFGEVEFKPYDGYDGYYLDNGWIDHGFELKDFVNELLENDSKLIRFLSGGLVFTGNDNSDTEERCFINRDEEYLDDYDYKSRTSFKVKNPYYMKNHDDYEWYWKGN